jgi:D-glycero-D-manno-heptose 1,7-bisphosphate phosphatase
MKKSAVFIDRDGTLIVDAEYLSDPDKLELYEDSAKSLEKLNKAGILAILVTNQSGVARGYFDENTVHVLNKKLADELKNQNAYLDAIYYCPHHKKGVVEEYIKECDCRKPKTGLIKQAVSDFKEIDLQKSYVIGDKASDIELAKNAGCKSILVKTGYGQQVLNGSYQEYIEPDFVAENMKDAVDWILEDLLKKE